MAHGQDGEDIAKHNDGGLVAIVGAGIVGISLAVGLVARGVRVVLYERASDFHEIGAGIAFTGVARQCMEQLSSDILESLRRVSNANKHAQDNYWDGYHGNDGDDGNENTPSHERNLLFSLPNAKMSWQGCLRSEFLNELSKALPQGITNFGKELVGHEDKGFGHGVMLRFADGTTAECDVLIGCDGINSCVRRQMFSSSHPEACEARYTNKTSFRFFVPIEKTSSTLGLSKAHNHCMHTGPGAHILSYPVAQRTMSNVVVFLTDENATSSPPGRERVLTSLGAWRPEVRAFLAHMPDAPMTWRIYDTADFPAPHYSKGNVAIVGDAAHASAPHHGAGAGFGMEDALALATVLTMAMRENQIRRPLAIVAALETYNHVRYDRTQWLVRSSRETGEIYEWLYPGTGSDPAKMKAELAVRQEKIWNFDVGEMVRLATNDYHARLETFSQ